MLIILEIAILLTILTHTSLITYMIYRHYNPVPITAPAQEESKPNTPDVPNPMNEMIHSLNEFMTDSKPSNKGDE